MFEATGAEDVGVRETWDVVLARAAHRRSTPARFGADMLGLLIAFPAPARHTAGSWVVEYHAIQVECRIASRPIVSGGSGSVPRESFQLR